MPDVTSPAPTPTPTPTGVIVAGSQTPNPAAPVAPPSSGGGQTVIGNTVPAVPDMGSLLSVKPSQTVSPAGGPPSPPISGTPSVATYATDSLPTPPSNWLELAKTRIAEVKSFYDKFAGKVGHNPYFYYNSIVKPLEDKVLAFAKTFRHTNAQGATISKEDAAKQLHASVKSLETNEDFSTQDSEAVVQESERQKQILNAKAQGQKQIIIQ